MGKVTNINVPLVDIESVIQINFARQTFGSHKKNKEVNSSTSGLIFTKEKYRCNTE